MGQQQELQTPGGRLSDLPGPREPSGLGLLVQQALEPQHQVGILLCHTFCQIMSSMPAHCEAGTPRLLVMLAPYVLPLHMLAALLALSLHQGLVSFVFWHAQAHT